MDDDGGGCRGWIAVNEKGIVGGVSDGWIESNCKWQINGVVPDFVRWW